MYDNNERHSSKSHKEHKMDYAKAYVRLQPFENVYDADT